MGLTCADEPAVLSILQMANCPEVGGHTLWANMDRAYDTLSPAMRDCCEGLTAPHDADPHGHSERTAIHPVHPP